MRPQSAHSIDTEITCFNVGSIATNITNLNLCSCYVLIIDSFFVFVESICDFHNLKYRLQNI